MKKIFGSFLLIFLSLTLFACANDEIIWTDNEPLVLEVDSETIKILQVTDLHLAYGISNRDQMTYDLIKNLASADDYDLIVVTGDITMSPQGSMLYGQFVTFMESLKTPWTLVFGNHDTDFHDYKDLVKHFDDTEYLYYKNGPQLEDGGVGNFKINFKYNDDIIYHAYFLDTKAERDIYTEEEGEYEYLSLAQVEWYEDLVQQDIKKSTVFMHIPLRQYMDPVNYTGVFLEDKVYAQGVDTGFFDAMVTYGLSHAVFVGHDHLNDFSFLKDDILLAYGRISGYTAYGYLERGGRHIEITNEVLTTYVILESEVSS
jgi:3',5'-cyclic AMP phosphodiesterase CpdA